MIRTYSMHRSLVEELDDFCAEVKAATGTHVDRSKLVICFAQLLREHRKKYDLSAVDSMDSLRKEIRRAFCRREAPGARRRRAGKR